ncbi:hypothetical protein S1OALGB6SA_1947 [Olavius algarvensis spirochete endosymbiont]|nr:hypothetical protein S1OALGB6SA_1947 [Olavius algarvensis spirochete endosymbiont]
MGAACSVRKLVEIFQLEAYLSCIASPKRQRGPNRPVPGLLRQTPNSLSNKAKTIIPSINNAAETACSENHHCTGRSNRVWIVWMSARSSNTTLKSINLPGK